MKNIVVIALSCVFMQQLAGQTNDPSPYCSAEYDGGISGTMNKFISKVQINALDWTHSSGTSNPSPGYTYYNNVEPATLNPGSDYEIIITHSGIAMHFVAVFIDYDHNNSFEEENNLAAFVTANTPDFEFPSSPSTLSFSVPADAIVGETRMRIMVFEDDDYTWNLNNQIPPPCTDYMAGQTLDYGETEDYDVIIGSEIPESVDQPDQITVTASPNPTSSVWTITGDASSFYHFQLFNLNGESVLNESGPLPKQLSAADLPSGTYLLRISNNTSAASTQVLVKD